jgi:hypothetical protein
MSATPARAAVKATPAAPGARAKAPVTAPAVRRRPLEGRRVPVRTDRPSTSRAALGGKLLTMLMLVLSGSLLPPTRLLQPGHWHSSFGHAAGQAGASTTKTREGPAAPRSASVVACPGSTVRAPPFGQVWQSGRLPRALRATTMAPQARGLGASPLAEPELLPPPADRARGEAPRTEPPPWLGLARLLLARPALWPPRRGLLLWRGCSARRTRQLLSIRTSCCGRPRRPPRRIVDRHRPHARRTCAAQEAAGV